MSLIIHRASYIVHRTSYVLHPTSYVLQVSPCGSWIGTVSDDRRLMLWRTPEVEPFVPSVHASARAMSPATSVEPRRSAGVAAVQPQQPPPQL